MINENVHSPYETNIEISPIETKEDNQLIVTKTLNESKQNFLINLNTNHNHRFSNIPLFFIVKTFAMMILDETPLFEKFSCKYGSIDVFVDHFLPLVHGFESYWSDFIETRILLVNALTHLMVHYAPTISRIKKKYSKFFKLLLGLLNQSDITTQVTAFRCLTKVHQRAKCIVTRRAWIKMTMKILTFCPLDSPVLQLATKYIIDRKPNKFKLSSIYNKFVRNDDVLITCLPFIQMIHTLVIESASHNDDPSEVFVFLINKVINDELYSNAALKVFIDAMTAFVENIEIMNWIIFLLRKSLIMSALAEYRKKYRKRREAVYQLISKIMNSNILYIQNRIKQIIKSISMFNLCLTLSQLVVAQDTEIDDITFNFLTSSINDEYIENDDLKVFIRFPFDDFIDNELMEA
ncbi:hypothetical protein TRFO_31586 [Tritrichomonas foetus]|uniref:Uncharacterized protein n=1 Tax=Tritrichomonas foetus TaxID=1144522 RepID=A0A1J4JQU6_9EUKA|nr:hypothetical protein TRFO_31586 [Tritrichomonas foetus]|eukprot:OHT01551.1 hypothetical protein TRFO_31586 [Tritrichomonas foetus]